MNYTNVHCNLNDTERLKNMQQNTVHLRKL